VRERLVEAALVSSNSKPTDTKGLEMAANWEKFVGAIGSWFVDPRMAAAVILLLFFLGWVILSEDRTRHLVSLIRALRQSERASRDGRRQRPGGR
jgi:hypothetical protein